MRFFFIIILEVVLMTTLISCRTKSTISDQESVSKIKFTETIFDYGDIPFNSDGKCEFEFQNVSDKPLVINTVKTSCGCTNPAWPKKPIGPGKKGVISIEYNTKITGTFQKSITVYSNAENSPAMLFIKGNVHTETLSQ